MKMEEDNSKSNLENTRKTTAPTSLPPITKLEGSKNYSSWSFAMKMLLIDCELWDCVDRPADYAKEVKDFNRLDAKARSKICLSIHESIYPVIMSAETSAETWKRLKSIYADCGLLRRLSLLKKLFGTKLSMHRDMEAYIDDIRETQQKLAEINAAVDEEFIGVIMLAGLSEDYNPMVRAFENSGTKITTDVVASLLLKEDLHQKPARSNSSVASSNPKKSSFCVYCKRSGHAIANCRLLLGKKGKKAS